jgi:hypothetical protein
VIVAAVVIGVLVGTSGSGGSPAAKPSASATARPLTTDEANRLAVMRFRVYQATGLHFSVTGLSSSQGSLSVNGDVDYQAQLGYAEVSGAGSTATAQWDPSQVVLWLGTGDGTTAPVAPPADPATPRPIDPTSSAFDALMLVMIQLGQDRPDNAQLLQQNGARWLRSDTVNGTKVDVFDGPRSTSGDGSSGAASSGPPAGSASAGSSAPASGASTIQYWVDAQGNPLRLTVDFPTGPVNVDLSASTFRPITRSPSLPAD